MELEDKLIFYGLEEKMEYRKWAKEIPFIQFPKHWYVRITPPFAGAVVRFYVSLTDGGDGVSVYLDCYDNLGCMGQPYWEAYHVGDDTARFYLNETKQLIKAIDKELKGRIHVGRRKRTKKKLGNGNRKKQRVKSKTK